MKQANQAKMSLVKTILIATALGLVSMGFLGSILLFVTHQVVEPMDDGTFSVRVGDGSRWSIATRNAARDAPVTLSVDGVRATVDGVAVVFQDDRRLGIEVDTPSEQAVYRSIMTARMPGDGVLTVDHLDDPGDYVLVKNDAGLFFGLLIPGILFMLLSAVFFGIGAMKMNRMNLGVGSWSR